MATRFRYTATTTSPSVSPAFQSYTHAMTLRRNLVLTDSSTLTNVALTPDAVDHIAPGATGFVQFVSAPLGANTFTIGDAFKQAIQALEASAPNNLQVQVFIGLVSNDGTSALATLRSKVLEGAEIATTLRNTFFSSTLSGGYTTVGGERLVIELSLSGTPTPGGGVDGHNGTLRFGGSGTGGDLPENDTETGTTFNPWIEFANTILFPAASTGGGGGKRKRKRRRRDAKEDALLSTTPVKPEAVEDWVPFPPRSKIRKRHVIARSENITVAATALAEDAAPFTDPQAEEALEDDEILLLALTRIIH